MIEERGKKINIMQTEGQKASRRGISAMTLVLFWMEIIEMPIKMQES